MKKNAPIIVGILICIAAMVLAYFWATNLMDSIYAYRSPLKDTPPKTGEILWKPITRSVVIVLIDGLRYDTSQKKDVMPFLNELRGESAYAVMHSKPPSYSQPSYAVLLTGAWPDINDGPAMNLDYADIPTFTQDDIFSAASRAGLTNAISAFNWFEKLVPQPAVDASFYTAGEDNTADEMVTQAALPWLGDGKYQLVLIHLDQVDYAGHHEGGPIDPRWDAAAHRADLLLQQIASAIDLSQDTLLVVSDHGHIDTGGHGGQDPIVLVEPFVLAGKGVIPADYGDIQMVDVAPTIAMLLGSSIPSTNQGHPLISMVDISNLDVTKVQSAISSQQAELARVYQTAIGKPVNVQDSTDIVAATQNAMDAARIYRVNIERIPRGIITFVLVFAFIILGGWHAKTYYGWMIAGVIAYILVFNIKYVLIDHKTYSLSSVIDATNLIASTALTTLLALFVGWLIFVLGTRIYQFKPRKVADMTMRFVLVTMSFVAIPILIHYFANGAVVTWTLPNFLLAFLGLLFLIQLLVVPIVGLFLTGISPLLGYFAHGK